eukprot:TRINITY_DN6139_c0_g1_i1.p1 TRINITY_DN6139_c0_g1~~TRINITY_DN6139_c0_g1_i1.p1  ORF type:complete len:184 (+),score=24.72 TRINITY_DN6139_c0_g1_i1:67-618(+)
MLAFALLVFFSALVSSQTPPGYPALHQICTVTLKPYSGNYNDTALFLSPFSRQRNTPELLYYANNGEFRIATAGDDWGISADLGVRKLEDFNQNQIYALLGSAETKWLVFNVEVGHVYAIFNVGGFYRPEIETCWTITPVSISDGSITVSYSVYYYRTSAGSSDGGDGTTFPVNQCSQPPTLQ